MGTSAGILASLAGVLVSLVLLFVPLGRTESASPGGEPTVVPGTTGIDYLLGTTSGNPPVLFFWSIFVLGFALLGGYAAWTGNRSLVVITTVALLALTLLGIASIGLLVAPVALLFALAVIWLPAGAE